MSFTCASVSSASFLTDCAASLIRSIAPLVLGRAKEALGARQHAVDLVGRIVELAGELAEILEREVDVALVLAHRRHDVVDLVDDAGDLLRVDRLHELIDVDERGVEPLGRIVEVIGERGAVADQNLEIVRARRKRLAERLHIADDVADLVRVDRREQAIGVLATGSGFAPRPAGPSC